jgi:hypothetical protein
MSYGRLCRNDFTRSIRVLASRMVGCGVSVARELPSRMAFGLIAALALRCESHFTYRTPESTPGGSGGVPNVGPGESPNGSAVPGGVVYAPVNGESLGSAGENPSLSGAGGSADQGPPSMGVADAVDLPDASSAPATLDGGVTPIEDCVLGEFQAPEPLTGLEQGLNPDLTINLWSPSLSADGLTLFFAVSANGVDELILMATRTDRGTVFGPPVAVDAVNSAGQDGTPMLSTNGLALYFCSTREGGLGSRDLWLSTRPDPGAPFTAPTLIAGVNSPNYDHVPWVSQDELTLLWATDRSGGLGQGDIWIARRSTRSDAFSNIAPLNGVNGTSDETRAVLGNDGLTIYFSSDRPGGVGDRDLWVATRNDPTTTFSQITNLAGVNSSSMDTDPVLSADERELLFASARDGQIRLWRSIRVCE